MGNHSFQAGVFGQTANGLSIPCYLWGSAKHGAAPGTDVLIVGGVHGDETEGVIAAHGLLGAFASGYSYPFSLTLVPALNLDGVLARERKNANGVDLNRNLPTKDWTSEVATERYHPGTKPGSEPENQALMTYLEQARPGLVISLHSWKPLLNTNGDCTAVAKAIHELTGYEIQESIGYPTPGCLGTYAGLEREMPTLTYELERGMAAGEILSKHVPAILRGLEAFAGEISK